MNRPTEPTDLSRLIAWLRDPNRKPPELAFTAGELREAADLVLNLPHDAKQVRVTFCCERCREQARQLRTYMIVCPQCGNKRCPKAEWHGYQCTDSNEPGQVGQPEEKGNGRNEQRQ